MRRRCATFFACAVLGILAVVLSGGSITGAQESLPEASAEQPPSFEVAAIKPGKPDDQNHSWNDSTNRISIENYTLRRLISVAYELKSESQVVGGPKWIDQQTFDIAAKIDDAEVAKLRKMTSAARHAERDLMLQSFLVDRFGLKLIWGKRKLPIFALVVAKSGAKFLPSAEKDGGASNISGYNGQVSATNISMDEFAHYLAILDEVGDHVVLNRTDLQGRYDLRLNFTRDHGNGVPADAAYPGLFTALPEQLGLELKPDKGPVDVAIVKAASEPAVD
ncbi:MAG: TIGR03435 family protein [Terracidiphilus sp.]